jgi:hypothetical protein
MDDETYKELLHGTSKEVLEDLKFFCAISAQPWASAGRGKGGFEFVASVSSERLQI